MVQATGEISVGVIKWFGVGFAAAVLGATTVSAQYRDTEEPAFEVVTTDRAFQLRDYDPMVVAEVTHNASSRRAASSASFQRLAAYIFAQDRPEGGESIAMTAPVIQDRPNQDEPIAMTSPVIHEETSKDNWRMRFVMPAKYTLDTLPTAPEDITLTEVPARRVAIVQFNGYGRENELAIMVSELSKWIDEQGLTAIGEPEYAFYDAPRVPARMRRNEVMIPVAKSE